MASLLIINYSMNQNHPLFAHQWSIVERLAASCETVNVISILDSGLTQAPKDNVKLYFTSWQPGSKISSSIRFLRVFFRIYKQAKPQLVFSHMTDAPAALVAWYLWTKRTPHYLWYAHAKFSKYLLVSLPFITKAISSTSGSFPLKTNRVIFLGQAVNADKFVAKDLRSLPNSLRVLTISRLDPSKQIDNLCKFYLRFRAVFQFSELCLVGSATHNNVYYEKYLRQTYAQSDGKHDSNISFIGSLNSDSIVSLLKDFDLFIHAFKGSLDKVLVEATMVGIPVISLNHEYFLEFGSWSGNQPSSNHDDFFCQEMEALKSLSSTRLRVELQRRSDLAKQKHSLDQWTLKLIGVFQKQVALDK